MLGRISTKGAVFFDAHDLPVIDLADLGLDRDLADHLLGSFRGLHVRRGDDDLAAFLDVDLGFSRGDDLLDDLARPGR